MGERRKQPIRMPFDGKLDLQFFRATITSHAGLLPFRELHGAFRLTENRSTMLSDPCSGKNTQDTMPPMLRQRVYRPPAGYEDLNPRAGTERLPIGPTMRRVLGTRAKETEAASTTELSRFQTEMSSSTEHRTAPMNLPGM